MTQPGNTDALALAGQRAITEATRLWNLDVVDYPSSSKHPRARECLALISEIIEFCGWLPDGGYQGGNSGPQWCGMTVGYVLAKAGLNRSWLAAFFASTMRLGAFFRYENWNEHKNPRPTNGDLRKWQALAPGKPLAWDPQPGDVVIVGNGKRKEGDHVTLGLSFDPVRRAFETISGNGGGVGPRGDHREGISRKEYAIEATTGYRAMFVGRIAFGDLVAEAP